MRTFIVQVNHPLVPFELNNLIEWRIDLVARCINAALWLDHDIRRDVEIFFCFSNSVTVRIDGSIRGMRPDERNIASFFRHIQEGKRFPGISKIEQTFKETAEKFKEFKCFVLDINGAKISEAKPPKDSVFILGDDAGFTEEVGAEKISLGPKSYLTSHCITVINNFMDLSL